MAASSQQLQAKVVVQVRGEGSLLGQDARRPGAPGPAPWRRRIPSREPQHSVAPTSPLYLGQAVLFQAGLDVLLRVCLSERGTLSGGQGGREHRVGGCGTPTFWAAPTHFRGLSSGTFGRNTDGRAGLE